MVTYTENDFERPPLGHTCRGDNWRYLKWTSVPTDVRDKMISHVKQWFNAQDLETASRVYVGGFVEQIKGGICSFSTIAVVTIDKAILEVLKELKPSRPFTLHSNGTGWFVCFIHNYAQA